MIAALELDMQENHEALAREDDELCRRKLVALRGELRKTLEKRGIILGKGASNESVLSCMSQLMCTDSNYVERLDTGWREEYEQFIQDIGSMVKQTEFNADTEPEEVVQSIETKLANQH
jgi:hypothetical protein